MVGFVTYLIDNGQKLAKLSLGLPLFEDNSSSVIKATPEPTPFKNIIEYDTKPLEFLEEIFPQLSPDPNRISHSVIETSVGGGVPIDNFYVKDTSESGLILTEELQKPLPFEYDINSDEPLVLIYHTHTSESYMSGFTGFYYEDSPTRDDNSSKNVTAVGDVLKKTLESYGISVLHDTTIHDYAYDGSYGRSWDTVAKYLEQYPSIKITIDLHRDSLAEANGTKYKPTVSINDRKAAQIMLIAGSDPTGELEFTHWEDNLIFNLKIQQKAEELYPGIMRPLMYCQRKYNMDATNASLLVEMGAEVNTISEARYSGELLGNVIAEVLIGE